MSGNRVVLNTEDFKGKRQKIGAKQTTERFEGLNTTHSVTLFFSFIFKGLTLEFQIYIHIHLYQPQNYIHLATYNHVVLK